MISILISVLLLAGSPPNPDWSTINTKHFTLRYMQKTKRLANNLKPSLEPTLDRIDNDLGTTFDSNIAVVLAPDGKTFYELQGNNVPRWASGTSYPGRRLIYLRPLTAEEFRHHTLQNIFAHELSHVLLYIRLNNHTPPRWLDEGIAVYQAHEFNLDRTNELLASAITGRFMSFDSLSESFPESGNAASVAYAQSEDMVKYIMRRYGISSFHKLLANFSETGDINQAVHSALGVTMPELEAQWQHHARMRYGLITVVGGTSFLWFAISLIAIWAYLKKRRQAALRKELWDIEDQIGNLSNTPITYH